MENAWNVFSARLLEKFSIPEIISIVGLAGAPSSSISRHGARQPLRPAIDSFWNGFDQEKKKRFIAVVAEEMLKRKGDLRPLLENDLSRLGLCW